MKKCMMATLLAGMGACLVGCQSTNVDTWRSDLETELCPAKFRPVYQVMKSKGIVSGTAEEGWTFWFFGYGPNTFANEIGGPLTLKPGVREAAFHDACAKSGATILLAPRFTTHKETGFLWFYGKTKVTVEGVPAKLVSAEEVK